ncbi:hypothetical protein [Niabella beijingensis]|uniref:hypothetical protein n=1 Tax=Niabella beijingensis TaxID=2872700 RepID=UPI001CBFB648|nr:hypothetical protein [Niabella beijingensis]MBZ4191261.1 hypothetical protein [Niabella beijingensis]
MKRNCLLYGALVLLLTVSCNGPVAEPVTGADSTANSDGRDTLAVAPVPKAATEEQVVDSLKHIPFVAESHRYIDSLTDHKHGIAFLIDTVSDKEVNFRAGYNGEFRFETYYLFTVNPQNFDIKITEPISGDKMTVDAYEAAQTK